MTDRIAAQRVSESFVRCKGNRIKTQRTCFSARRSVNCLDLRRERLVLSLWGLFELLLCCCVVRVAPSACLFPSSALRQLTAAFPVLHVSLFAITRSHALVASSLQPYLHLSELHALYRLGNAIPTFIRVSYPKCYYSSTDQCGITTVLLYPICCCMKSSVCVFSSCC